MDGDLEFNLFVPFINVTSVGGKFDDAAFSAGYEMGLLDFKLFQAAAIQCENLFVTIRADNSEQADLIAMKHKLIIEQKIPDESGQWVSCLFVRPTNVIDISPE